MAAVKPIDASSIHKICSGQVILDLATAVKELVENSLDAQARTIEIRFREYGLHSVEVIDDGTGIDQPNYEKLALKHCTSKITKFEDLNKVESFGFRGEALSSLCALSKVTVSTCTQEEVPTGTRLEYDCNGYLVRRTPVARERGTTVLLQNLFESIPVRYRDFKKNVKREFGKALTLLHAYAIICLNTKITCTNQPNNGAKTTVLSTSCNNTMRENIANLFGAKIVTQIVPLDFTIEMKPERQTISKDSNKQPESDHCPVHVVGYISKPIKGYGRGSADRQYYFINGRPCTLPKVAKVINELYKGFSTNQYPFLVADFQLAKFSYDVNVSPDKRIIFIHNENKIVEALKSEMERVLEPFRSTFTCLNTEGVKLPTNENSSCNVASDDTEKNPREGTDAKEKDEDNTDGTEKNKYPRNNAEDNAYFRNKNAEDNAYFRNNNGKATLRKIGEGARSENANGLCKSNSLDCRLVESEFNKKKESESIKLLPSVHQTNAKKRKISFSIDNEPGGSNYKRVANHNSGNDDDVDMSQDSETMPCVNDESSEESPEKGLTNVTNDDKILSKHYIDGDSSKSASSNNSAFTISTGNLICDSNDTELEASCKMVNSAEMNRIELIFDVTRYSPSRFKNNSTICTKRDDNIKSELRDLAGITVTDNKVAESELNKIITKEDFAQMEIVGQFNLGFIIAKLNGSGDLFIIDQHASDEKYNFENLQLHTKIESQRLISPRRLELTVAEEMVAIENMKILQDNGFELEVDDDAKPSNKLKLLSQPICKNMVLDVKEELIFLLTERPGEM
ncbi:15436_t:CDS:10, partial [Acaulospora colombiana]